MNKIAELKSVIGQEVSQNQSPTLRGKLLKVKTEVFTYSESINFFLDYDIKSIVTLDVNGMVQTEGDSFEITGNKDITLLGTPSVGSTIGVTYVY